MIAIEIVKKNTENFNPFDFNRCFKIPRSRFVSFSGDFSATKLSISDKFLKNKQHKQMKIRIGKSREKERTKNAAMLRRGHESAEGEIVSQKLNKG